MPRCEEFGRLALVQRQTAGVAGVEVLQSKALAFGDAERIDVLLDAVEDLFSRHGADPFRRRDRRAGQLYQLKQQLARHCELSLRAVHQDQPQRARRQCRAKKDRYRQEEEYLPPAIAEASRRSARSICRSEGRRVEADPELRQGPSGSARRAAQAVSDLRAGIMTFSERS